MRPQHETAKE